MTTLKKTAALLTGFATMLTGFAATSLPQAAAQPIIKVADPAHPGDAAVAYPGTFPGTATSTSVGSGFRLSNEAITATITGGANPNITGVTAHGVANDFSLRNLFALRLANGTIITPSNSTAGATTAVDIAADADSIRLAERHPGKAVRTVYTYTEGARSFDIIWTAMLRDGSNYIQSKFEIGNVVGGFDVQSVDLFNATLTGARIVGKDNGNPIVTGAPGAETLFVGVENPMAKQTVSGTAISFPIARSGDLKAGELWEYSASIGASPEGQLRRAFLYYTEREKAHARRPFLHYQSWFDLKPSTSQDPASNTLVIQADELNHAIDLFGSEMTERGAHLDSFLVDDGWDYLRAPQVDETNLNVWDFDPTQFPTGFAPQKAIADKYDGSLSVWMSPFGGYGDSANRRIALNNSKPADQRFEYTGGRFALSGDRYNSHFRDVILGLMDDFGVQGFKFDGIGGGLHQTGPNPTYLRDYERLLELMEDMRSHKSDTFINTTVGTWGSPYWTWYTDTVWRDDHDAYRVGAGDQREQYINYRDSIVYTYNVAENPLFSITNLMNHGFIFSTRAPQFQADMDLSEESVRYATAADLRGYFAMGFSLQELYVRNTIVDPARIGEANADWFWDELAKNAKWSRENTALLTDAHWLGGNAALGEMYGTAAWSDVSGTEEGMVMLRNPSTRPQTYTLDIGEALELPARAHGRYKLVERDGQHQDIVVEEGTPYYLTLKPFEVLLFEASVTDEALSESVEPPPAPMPLSTEGWTATASSQETAAESTPASNAIDGDTSTIWHTKYQGGAPAYPHWIQIDMGEVQEINGFEYVPRTSGTNGSIDRYKLSVSTDGSTWTVVDEGEFDGLLTYLEFDAIDARYIKLDALSEIENRTWATAAELRVFGPAAVPEVPRLVPVAKNTWSAVCSSEEFVGEANGAQGPCRLAVDDNEGTYWHTKFEGGIDPMPHEIVVDMGGAFPVEQLEYIPRQGYDRANGFIADYELLLSLDSETWTSVAEGTFEYETGNTAQRFLVDFEPQQARYFKFVAKSSLAGNAYAGAAEFNMMQLNPSYEPPTEVVAPVVTDISAQTATVGTAITPITVAATGTDPQITVAGLPDGLTYADGRITGTPTADGVATVTVTATNSAGTDTATFTITVAKAADTTKPVIDAIATISGTVGTAIAPVTVRATDQSMPLTFALSGVAGLSINPTTGVISGTPTAAGTQTGTVTVTDAKGNSSTTTFTIAVAPKPKPTTPPRPVFERTVPYTKPGLHDHNGRQWRTACEAYSQTERCRTEIWASVVKRTGNTYSIERGWAFNNLTYLPFMQRSQWKSNPLGGYGQVGFDDEFTGTDGAKWRTECDTAATGGDACRSYRMTTVYFAVPKASGGYLFGQESKWVFNNIVMFGDYARS